MESGADAYRESHPVVIHVHIVQLLQFANCIWDSTKHQEYLRKERATEGVIHIMLEFGMFMQLVKVVGLPRKIVL